MYDSETGEDNLYLNDGERALKTTSDICEEGNDVLRGGNAARKVGDWLLTKLNSERNTRRN